MLSQRISNAYLAIGLDISSEKSQVILNESMGRFDRQLVEFCPYSPRPDIKATYSKLDAVGSEFKSEQAGQLPRRERVAALLDLDSKMLELANQGVGQLEQLADKSIGRLVHTAGRQRMLLQSAAKIYLAQSWRSSGCAFGSGLAKGANQVFGSAERAGTGARGQGNDPAGA